MMRFNSQQGAAMIELLIAMLIIAFGVLGFVGMQSQTALAQVEGYQRSQALILINDITERMSLNRANAASYVSSDIGISSPTSCASPTTQTEKDLCQWSSLLQGSAEVQGTTKLGAMIGARGCIIADPAVPPSPNTYLITVAWQGVIPTGAPASTCGQNQYTAENLRRTVNKVVRFAGLN